MFFNSLNKKLKKSYSTVNPEIGRLIFPNGESEYIYVGMALNLLFKNRDVFELIKIYASVYGYYHSTMGNTAKTYLYAKKKSSGMLCDRDVKDLVALVMFNITDSKQGFSDPIAAVRYYRGFVDTYIETVEKIKKYEHHFKPKTVDAGTQNSPLLVDGVCGVRDYINTLNIPGVDKITYKRTTALHLTDNTYGISYAIDEYTLYNEKDSTEIAKLWFNIYGTENTDVLPACLSGKEPFSAEKANTELFEAGIKEYKSIEEVFKNLQVPYDQIKLVTATFVYLHVVWIFSFGEIRLYQSEKVKKLYTERFITYIKQSFENAPYKAVLDSESSFENMLRRVDARVRNSYHANNRTLLDDGLSYEFLIDIGFNGDSVRKIQPIIAKKIMEDWVAIGRDAGMRYLT